MDVRGKAKVAITAEGDRVVLEISKADNGGGITARLTPEEAAALALMLLARAAEARGT